ncbi:phosphatase PAP2 family protein [Rasiella rasia]|uniref:Phosphatase PAP2 family protein n=1 Tax=Rasiella rasia TaxID=2744027 RepID=A0A6G6GJ46_9FLAO|nr:phosphatase PAP2 family protein [Rasiella rasia]QIE58568.1 phosphatase PAP2 family protein [Rasiella rasia]
MKNLLLLAITLLTISVNAQKSESPYEWDWTRDGIWTGAALGGSVGGFLLIQNKDDIDPDTFEANFGTPERLQESIDNINFIDRWAAGKHDENANKISDIPFAISFVGPFAMLFDDEINDHTGQYLGLYLESMATTAAMYTITAGVVNRSRPYVYDDSGDTNLDRRRSNNGQRSFYSGHVATTATATFFTAKVYSDFNPDSPAKIWVWTGAAVVPAAVGYFRIEAGQHFLTDVALGYALGAGVGILVPELHKKKNTDGLSIYPTGGRTFLGDDYTAMAMRLTF